MRSTLLALLAAVALTPACTSVPHAYYVDVSEATRVQPLTPADRAQTLVAARRAKGGAEVRVRADTIDFAGAKLEGTELRVVSRAKSPMLVAGQVLTWVGTAISITGTLLFLIVPDGNLHTAGFITAPSAEPLMITGTVLWVLSLLKHPQEAGAGR